jgi:hypothetical protein
MLAGLLIGAEGARLLENAIAFPSCVGGFKDVIQCPAGDPAGAKALRRLPGTPAESEAPSTPINIAAKSTISFNTAFSKRADFQISISFA